MYHTMTLHKKTGICHIDKKYGKTIISRQYKIDISRFTAILKLANVDYSENKKIVYVSTRENPVVDPFKFSSADEYALAKGIGEKRFGSECQHENVSSGHCINCQRTVL